MKGRANYSTWTEKKILSHVVFVPYFVLLFLAIVEPQFGRKRQSLVFNTGVPHGRMFGSLYFTPCGQALKYGGTGNGYKEDPASN